MSVVGGKTLEKEKNAIDRIVLRTVEKIKCIKDPNDPDYARLNGLSFFVNMVGAAMIVAVIQTIVQRQYSFLPWGILLCVIANGLGTAVRIGMIGKTGIKRIIVVLGVFLSLIGPVIYYTGGGLYSATAIWLFLILVYTVITMEGYALWICLVLQLGLYGIVLALDYRGIITPQGALPEEQWVRASITSFVMVALCVGALISYQLFEYKRQQQLLMSQLEEIEFRIRQAEDLNDLYEQQKKMTEAALNVKNDFITNMNHETRTPINAVMGLAEVAKINSSNPRYVTELSDQIYDHAKNLLDIFNKVLYFTDGQNGGLEIAEEEYEAEEIVTQFCECGIPLMKSKNITYSIFSKGLPSVLMGDFQRIKQIEYYLVTYAAKFTPDGGKIDFSVVYEDGFLTMCISDTGIGIPSDEMGRIFGKFGRAEKTEHRHTQGVGLGLSYVKMLCELMHGSIDVESEIDVGSTFTVKLPQKSKESKGE